MSQNLHFTTAQSAILLYKVCRAAHCNKIIKNNSCDCGIDTCISELIFTALHSSCITVSAAVGVDAELEASSAEDVTMREERIVSQWREVSADEQHHLCDRVDEILRPLGFQTSLLVIRRANSIALYLFCMTLLAVTGLRNLWRRRDLRRTVESLFTVLAGTARSVRVNRLTWPVTDYERCLQFFSSIQSKPAI